MSAIQRIQRIDEMRIRAMRRPRIKATKRAPTVTTTVIPVANQSTGRTSGDHCQSLVKNSPISAR